MKRILFASLFLLSSSALADTPPAAPVQAVLPVVLTAEDLGVLNTYLQGQPYSLAKPLMDFLMQKEQQAQAADTAAKKK